MAWLPTVTGHTSRVRGKRTLRRFRNLRYSRLGSLRYGAVPRCAPFPFPPRHSPLDTRWLDCY
jgi:hypothetical protein